MLLSEQEIQELLNADGEEIAIKGGPSHVTRYYLKIKAALNKKKGNAPDAELTKDEKSKAAATAWSIWDKYGSKKHKDDRKEFNKLPNESMEAADHFIPFDESEAAANRNRALLEAAEGGASLDARSTITDAEKKSLQEALNKAGFDGATDFATGKAVEMAAAEAGIKLGLEIDLQTRFRFRSSDEAELRFPVEQQYRISRRTLSSKDDYDSAIHNTELRVMWYKIPQGYRVVGSLT
jgi:hypothetical protein